MSKTSLRRAMQKQKETSANAAPYKAPTDEQLANFVSVYCGNGFLKPSMILAVFDKNPKVRERWAETHRQFQESLNKWAGQGGQT